MRLLKAQQAIANDHLESRIFLEGVAGTGKTRAAIERIKTLLKSGVRPDSILVWVPSATLALPYRDALRRARVSGGADVQTITPGKLAYEMLNLFFPLIAEEVGFANPDDPPHFLSLELVQYYMTRFVEPEIEQQDYFNSVHITRNRLFTQIIDNLNKSALVGFDYHTIAEQLTAAWRGDISQHYIYQDAQVSAETFRNLCLQHNLLDFSLQMSLFHTILWQRPQVRRYLSGQYRHLIVDNIEEETPAAHDILRDWLPDFESALVIYDTQAGYRRFLGADAVHAYSLKDDCEIHLSLDNHRVMSSEIEALQTELAISLDVPVDEKAKKVDAREAIVYTDTVYYTQMVEWIVEAVAALVHEEGVSPGEIVILSAYLPDALRFALQTRLDEQTIPNQAHRPSRALREEAATRTLITLAKIAHPHWELPATAFDVTSALKLSIKELDLVRAKLMVGSLYLTNRLHSFGDIQSSALQERITFELGGRYDRLYHWLRAYQDEDNVPLDVFFSRLFGEVLSQKGFGFHDDPDAVTTAANLIDSAREFRQTLGDIEPDLDTAAEYIGMVDRGVIANQYIRNDTDNNDVVRIMPAYTFLLSNQPVDYQFWVNVGSAGWSQRLQQPITHPYVLSRQWEDGRIWTDEDEVIADRETLSTLALGLLRRCRKKVYLGISQFSEQGYEQRGSLLLAFQAMLRRLNAADAAEGEA